MRKFKLFSYLLIAGMLFSNANMYAMDGQNQNLGNEEKHLQGENIVEVANIRYDCSFKKVFTEVSNRDILANLLNNIYGFDMSNKNGMRIRRILITSDTTIPDTEDGVKTCFDVHCTCIVATSNKIADEVLSAISAIDENERSNYIDKNFEQNAYFFDVEMQNSLQHSFVDRLLLYENKLQDQGFDQIHNICNHKNHDDKFLYDLPRARVLAFISFFLEDSNRRTINKNKVFLHTAPCIIEDGTLQCGNLVLGENSVPKIVSNKQLVTYVQLQAINIGKKDDYSELELWLKLLYQARSTSGGYSIDETMYQSSSSIMKAIRVLKDFYDGNSRLLNACAAREEQSLAEASAREAQIRQESRQEGKEEGIQETLKKSVTSAYTAASTLTEDFPIPFDNVFYNSISQTVSNNPDYKSFIIECAKRKYPNWDDAEYEKAVSSKKQKFSSNDESKSLPTK